MRRVPTSAPAAASLQSVERVTQILLAFGASAEPLGVSEVARRVSLPKSLVFRVLTTLVGAGFLHKWPDARYSLGSRAAEMGLAALRFHDVVGASMPHMQRLSVRTQETITLTLRVGTERTYAAQVVSQQDVRKTVRTGERYPLYAGNSGRAILAWFSREELDAYLASVALVPLTHATICDPDELRRNLAVVRARGYAVSRGERDPWSAGIGAPIFDATASVVGALSICAPIGRLPIDDCERYGRLVVDAALGVTADMDGSVPRALSGTERIPAPTRLREHVSQRQLEEVAP